MHNVTDESVVAMFTQERTWEFPEEEYGEHEEEEEQEIEAPLLEYAQVP